MRSQSLLPKVQKSHAKRHTFLSSRTIKLKYPAFAELNIQQKWSSFRFNCDFPMFGRPGTGCSVQQCKGSLSAFVQWRNKCKGSSKGNTSSDIRTHPSVRVCRIADARACGRYEEMCRILTNLVPWINAHQLQGLVRQDFAKSQLASPFTDVK